MSNVNWKRLIGIPPVRVFSAYAHSLGYTVKIVGDYAYKKSRRCDSPMIKLWGCNLKTDTMTITFFKGHGRKQTTRRVQLKFSELAAQFGHKERG